MRRSMLLLTTSLMLFANAGCPTADPDGPGNVGGQDTPGPAGPQGPQGPAGPQGPPGAPAPTPPTKPSPVGVWRVDSGELFRDFVYSDLKVIEFRADGTATIHAQDPVSLGLQCMPTIYLTYDKMLALDTYDEDGEIALFDLVDQDHLKLTGVATSLQLTRIAEVPAELRCGTLTPVRSIALQRGIEPYGGLAYQGSPPGLNHGLLWFTDYSYDTRAINVETGAEIPSLKLKVKSPGNFVQAMQGDTFWGICNCGDDDPTQVNRATNLVLDEVKVNQLGAGDVDALAYDEAGAVLWAATYDRTTRTEQIVRINAGAEPDLLIDKRPFAGVQAISFAAGRLWVLSWDGSVLEIDPATAKAVKTYANPDRKFYWKGIAVVGDRIFLSGDSDFDNVSEIVEFRLP